MPTPLAARVSRAETVARELQREIGEGHARGERLGTKLELRERFGVAVATMNEAIRLLETRAIVETRPGPGGGVFVAGAGARLAFSHLVLGFSDDGTAHADCLELRDALEPVICGHAARHHRARDVREMRALADRMEASLDDPVAMFDANWALHRRIASLCRNAPMRSVYMSLMDFLEGSTQEAEIGDFDAQAVLRVHRDLVEAIDAGPGPHLDAAVERHRPTQSVMRARRPARRLRSGTAS